jgi:hypothetical protein
MKPFYLLLLGFFWSGIATAQYPSTNYWFAELGGATPLSQVKQEIYRGSRQKSVSWSPTSWLILNAGFHLESEKNGFIEPFLHIRRLNESAGLLLGLRVGRGFRRSRWFIETEYGGERGSLLSYSTTVGRIFLRSRISLSINCPNISTSFFFKESFFSIFSS